MHIHMSILMVNNCVLINELWLTIIAEDICCDHYVEYIAASVKLFMLGSNIIWNTGFHNILQTNSR